MYAIIHLTQCVLRLIQQEHDTLCDTSRLLFGKKIEPSHASFFPIGHIALHKDDPSIPQGSIKQLPTTNFLWIKTLYVSRALQGIGIGGLAMEHVEAVAASPPLNARHLLLDTLCEEDQLNEDIAVAYFGQVPKVGNAELEYDRNSSADRRFIGFQRTVV
jgi:GNAT superfamily N-acetyltransferase